VLRHPMDTNQLGYAGVVKDMGWFLLLIYWYA